MSLAKRFCEKARELVPHQDELQNLDPALDDPEVIDEIMFRRSEYLGGMAAVILALIASEPHIGEVNTPTAKVKLSPGEESLFASIIEHIYPEPQEGTTLPVEHYEKRAASGLARKGLVVLSVDSRGFDQMTFTALGESIYKQQLAAANREEAAA